jgi:molybdate transport system ATP-binding protein
MSWGADLSLTQGAFTLDVNLQVPSLMVALVGPNASGKSTLIRAMAGAVVPERGKIWVGEQVLFESRTAVCLPPEARRVGYVPQGQGLFPHLNALDNIAFGLRIHENRREARLNAYRLLKAMGSETLALRGVNALSGGERQRVALARALAPTPGMLLLDEPLSSLDPISKREMRTFLQDHLLSRPGPTLMSTHDARTVAALDADVVVLEEGRVVQMGPWEELAERPATAFIAEFFGRV